MAQNPNIDDDTRARAMKSVEAKAAAVPRVVSKKELEASGMSLRDYMNKQRGLTRRKESDPTAGNAKDVLAQTIADRIDPGNDGGESVARRQDAEAKAKSAFTPRGPATRKMVGDGGEAAVRRQDEEARRDKDMGAYKSRGSSTLSDVVRPGTNTRYENTDTEDMAYKRGGKVKSASRRGDGIAQRGKTRA
jgi:hypothetical protein